MNRKASAIAAVIASAVLIVIDQITKHAAFTSLRVNGALDLIPGVFELRYVENRGAAWGMLTGARIFFVAVALLLCALVVWLFVKMPETKRFRWLRIVSVLLVAGAVGNMIDRIKQGFVVDFLSFYLIHFPVFNVADCYVTVAAFSFAFLILFYYKDEELTFYRRSGNKSAESGSSGREKESTGSVDDTGGDDA